MSVIKFSAKEIAIIGRTIEATPELRDLFLTTEEKLWSQFVAKTDSFEALENAIRTWTDRLFISNQLAYAYTYTEEAKIVRLEEKDFEGIPLSNDKLLEAMRSIRYNIITNGGNTFLGEADSEKLDRMIEYSKDLLLREREKVAIYQ